MPTVNIYLATTNSTCQNNLETRCLPQLPNSEKQRYRNLHPKRQIEWLHARALLHTALEKHYGLNDGLQYLQHHEKGGLYFPDKNLHVSISHTHKTVGVALISQPIDIGLDLETIQPRELAKHTDKVFTSIENAWLTSQAPEQRLAAFYRLWTFKEACIKACRQSIWHALQALTFDLSQAGTIISSNSVFHGHWQLAWGMPQTGLQLALALKNPSVINTLQLWKADLAISGLTPTPHKLKADYFHCTPAA